ncbi:MAG: hypothetical protein K2N01_09960 [Lachnospiraceae bacterium]|nr:hypothetical protein [Lachnospiraceae bacterium]
MPKREKKIKQNKQQNKESSVDVSDLEADEEIELTKDMVDKNREWALKKNRKNKYASD